jgi:hypothetical protein
MEHEDGMTTDGTYGGSRYNGWKRNDGVIMKRSEILKMKAGRQRVEYEDGMTKKWMIWKTVL